jgi:hypothetical protein
VFNNLYIYIYIYTYISEGADGRGHCKKELGISAGFNTVG